MSYTHFTLEERKYLQQLLSEGCSFRKIAIILERSPSSVSREVRRNKAKWRPHQKPDNPYWYNHWRAQNLYIRRRRESIRMALLPDSEEWNYIVSHLEQYWSPEAICGRWHKDYPGKKTLCFDNIPIYLSKTISKYYGQNTLKTAWKTAFAQKFQLQLHSARSDYPSVAGGDLS